MQNFLLHLVSFRNVQFRWSTYCKVVMPDLHKSRMPC
jgi:hypothetical protein